jgi:hypothetical protein
LGGGVSDEDFGGDGREPDAEFVEKEGEECEDKS